MLMWAMPPVKKCVVHACAQHKAKQHGFGELPPNCDTSYSNDSDLLTTTNMEASEGSDEGIDTDDEDLKHTMRTFFGVFSGTSQAHVMQAEKK